MDETPSDSGALATSALAATTGGSRAASSSEADESRWGETGIRRLNSSELWAQFRRPAVWGLLLLIAVVIAVQVWLLFL